MTTKSNDYEDSSDYEDSDDYDDEVYSEESGTITYTLKNQI